MHNFSGFNPASFKWIFANMLEGNEILCTCVNIIFFFMFAILAPDNINCWIVELNVPTKIKVSDLFVFHFQIFINFFTCQFFHSSISLRKKGKSSNWFDRFFVEEFLGSWCNILIIIKPINVFSPFFFEMIMNPFKYRISHS